jgi:hypothetical protein
VVVAFLLLPHRRPLPPPPPPPLLLLLLLLLPSRAPHWPVRWRSHHSHRWLWLDPARCCYRHYRCWPQADPARCCYRRSPPSRPLAQSSYRRCRSCPSQPALRRLRAWRPRGHCSPRRRCPAAWWTCSSHRLRPPRRPRRPHAHPWRRRQRAHCPVRLGQQRRWRPTRRGQRRGLWRRHRRWRTFCVMGQRRRRRAAVAVAVAGQRGRGPSRRWRGSWPCVIWVG